MQNGPRTKYVGAPIIYAFIEEKRSDGWKTLFEVVNPFIIRGHYVEELAHEFPLRREDLGSWTQERTGPELITNRRIGHVTAAKIRERMEIGKKEEWAEANNDSVRGERMATILAACGATGNTETRLVIIDGMVFTPEVE